VQVRERGVVDVLESCGAVEVGIVNCRESFGFDAAVIVKPSIVLGEVLLKLFVMAAVEYHHVTGLVSVLVLFIYDNLLTSVSLSNLHQLVPTRHRHLPIHCST
jgi:hypothetical protein